jgi:hypothetical protein
MDRQYLRIMHSFTHSVQRTNKWAWQCFVTSHTGLYSGRKITESLGNVTVKGEKRWKEQEGARLSTVCLSLYSITENIYYSQLSSVAILLQPEPVSHRTIIQGKYIVLCSLSLCAIVLLFPPASHVSTSNGQRSSQLFCVHYNSRLWIYRLQLHSFLGRCELAGITDARSGGYVKEICPDYGT